MRIKRSNILLGGSLILVGVFSLVAQFIPGVNGWIGGNWPLFIIVIAVLFLAAGLLAAIPALVIPAAIIAGIGGLLLWQNLTGLWETWAYVWTLIPGFVGVGLVGYDLLRGQFKLPSGGLVLLLISFVLFAIFGSFLGGPVELLRYWPVLLILIGLRQLFKAAIRKQ